MALGAGDRLKADLVPDATAEEVVRLDVDPTPDPRLSRLIGRVVIGRPLQADVTRGPLLEAEGGTLSGDEFAQASGKIR